MVFRLLRHFIGVFDTFELSGDQNTLFLSSHHLYLIIDLILDLFVSCGDSLVGEEAFTRTKCLESL